MYIIILYFISLQCTPSIYLKKKKKAHINLKQPQTGPSGGIPKENVVIIEDDSSMCVTVPADLPVGQVGDSDIGDRDPV